MQSIMYRIEKYLKFDPNYISIRKCYKSEEWKPFKLRKNCLPLKGFSFCPDFESKIVYVTFVDDEYRCYVVCFLKKEDFEEFVERLCDLYSTSCLVYSFCSCS